MDSRALILTTRDRFALHCMQMTLAITLVVVVAFGVASWYFFKPQPAPVCVCNDSSNTAVAAPLTTYITALDSTPAATPSSYAGSSNNQLATVSVTSDMLNGTVILTNGVLNAIGSDIVVVLPPAPTLAEDTWVEIVAVTSNIRNTVGICDGSSLSTLLNQNIVGLATSGNFIQHPYDALSGGITTLPPTLTSAKLFVKTIAGTKEWQAIGGTGDYNDY